MTSASFIPCLKLSEQFYHEAVRPLLENHFPGLQQVAGLLDASSEVLGFNLEMSTDHGWSPRLTIFLPADDHQQLGGPIRDTVAKIGYHEGPV